MWMDQVARRSRMAEVEPACKIVVALAGIGAAWASPNLATSVLLATAWLLAARWNMVRPTRSVFFFWSAPILFLVASCSLVAFEFSPSAPSSASASFPLFSWIAWTDPAHIERSILLFFRGLTGINALFFIAGSTPLSSLESTLARSGFPAWLVDIMASSFRMIGVFAEQAQARATAILSRNGWSRWRHSWRCSAWWLSGLFVGALLHAKKSERAMASRCGSGATVLRWHPTPKFSAMQWGVATIAVLAQWCLVLGGNFLGSLFAGGRIL